MKKASLHSSSPIQLAALSLLLLLFSSSSANTDVIARDGAVYGARLYGRPASNATRIGDDLVGGEEFLMESETARRILQGTPRKTIQPLDRSKTFCKAKAYGSCIGPASKNYRQRKCGYRNTCGKSEP